LAPLILLPHSNCPPETPWGRLTVPFLGKHDRPITPCLSDKGWCPPSTQQTLCLVWQGGWASFLLQCWYSCFIQTKC